MATHLDDVTFQNQGDEVKPLSKGDLTAVLEQIQQELAEAQEISRADCESKEQQLSKMIANEK